MMEQRGVCRTLHLLRCLLAFAGALSVTLVRPAAAEPPCKTGQPIQDIHIPATATNGSVTIPYEDNVFCQWRLNAPRDDQRISLYIPNYNIEFDGNCGWDHLAVYDGRDQCAEPLSGFLCGQGNGVTWQSSSSQILIAFRSDAAFNLEDITVHYSVTEKQTCNGTSPCSMTRSASIRARQVTISRACTRKLVAQPKHGVFVSVVWLTGIADCAESGIRVYSMVNGSTQLQTTLCSRETYYSNTSADLLLAVALRPDGVGLLATIRRLYIVMGYVRDGEWALEPPLQTPNSGVFSTSTSLPFRSTSTHDVYAWHVRAPLGSILTVSWTLMNYVDEACFIMIKEGHDSTFPTLHIESNIALDQIKEIWHSVFIQDDLLKVNHKRKPLVENNTVEVNYFEFTFIFGRPKKHGMIQLEGQYTQSSLLVNKQGKLCKQQVVGEAIVKHCSKGLETNLIQKAEPMTFAIELLATHYNRWNFALEPGMYGKITFGRARRKQTTLSHIYGMYDCTSTGFIVEEFNQSGERVKRIGPLCSNYRGEFVVASSRFSVVYYWSSRLGQVEDSSHEDMLFIINSTICKGITVEKPLVKERMFDVTDSKCSHIQALIPQAGQPISMQVRVENTDNKLYLGRYGAYCSEYLRSQTSSLALTTMLTTDQLYKIAFNYTCTDQDALWFAEFLTSYETDCDSITKVAAHTIRHKSFCGFVRLGNTFGDWNTGKNFVFWFWSPDTNATKEDLMYYELNFKVLHLESVTMTLREQVFTHAKYGIMKEINGPDIIVTDFSWMYELFEKVHMTDFIVDTLRTDKFMMLFSGDNNVKDVVVMDYRVRYHHGLAKTAQQDHLCPPGFVNQHRSCYLLVSSRSSSTWHQAENACQQRGNGSHLITITSREEMAAIKHMLYTRWAREVFSTKATAYMLHIGLHSKEKVGFHKWIDGNPLVFSEWYNPETMKHAIDAVWDIVPQKANQPLLEENLPCTAMFPVPYPRYTNWAKIPCDFQARSGVEVGYICEMEIKQNESQPSAPERVSGWVERTADGDIFRHPVKQCPKDWTFVGNKCFHFGIKPYGNWSTSNLLCSENNTGWLSTKDSSHQIKDLLELRKLASVTLWIGDQFTNISRDQGVRCPAIRSKYKQNEFSIEEVQTDCSHKLPYICETSPLTTMSECQAQQFQCSDGTCLSNSVVCDGSPDCSNGEDESQSMCKQITFSCHNGEVIPYSQYCDHVAHCSDSSDENCIYPECDDEQFQCVNKQCIPDQQRCDFTQDCSDGSDENDNTCAWQSKCDTLQGFLCHSGLCLPYHRINDKIQDCPGFFQEDESKSLIGRYSNDSSLSCSKRHTDGFNCGEGEEECAEGREVCVYDIDSRGAAHGCTNFAHIESCKLHECPDMFKCPNSYCIPNRRVCDGTWDCVNGWDEQFCFNFSCPVMVRCKGEIRCIDQHHICDGQVDCKFENGDEMFCDFLTCPEGCSCIGYHADCSQSNAIWVPKVAKTVRSLILKNNSLQLEVSTFNGFSWLAHLDISYNNISMIPPFVFSNQSNLVSLDLTYNNIRLIHKHAFWGLYHLQKLLLKGNPLQQVERGAFIGLDNMPDLDLSRLEFTEIRYYSFEGLAKLKMLTLKDNRVKTLEDGAFKGLQNVSALNLEGNQIRNMPLDTFQSLQSLERLNTDAYKFCCIADTVGNCTPSNDEFSSCSDLMANPTLQVAIWVLGAAATVGNIFVIIWRVKFDTGNITSLLVMNLAISDLLMGVYMLIIASADLYYRGNYILNDADWRESAGCKIAGTLSTLSSEVSVTTLLVMTVERGIVIIFPFKSKLWRLELRGMKVLCAVCWAIWFVLSIIPLFGADYFGNYYGNNGVCLPFTLSRAKNPGWEYSTAMFVVYNLLAFFTIALGYFCIYRFVKESRKKSKRDDDDMEVKLAIRSTFIIFTDFACWMPVILLSILALNNISIPPVVSAWVAVFVLPLNSAVNPILYTLSTITLKKKAKKPDTKKGKKSATASTSLPK